MQEQQQLQLLNRYPQPTLLNVPNFKQSPLKPAKHLINQYPHIQINS